MKTTITNGTWTVKPLKSGNLKVFVEGKGADGNKCDFWVATCPNEANANLMASAPEMLRFITFIAKKNKGKYDETLSARDNFHSRIAQRILAKAEGK